MRRLGDRDAVEGAVELAVAAAVEAVAPVLAGARFERCDAGVAGELRVGVGSVRSVRSRRAAWRRSRRHSRAARAVPARSAAVRACSSRSRARIVRVRPRQRPTSSRAIRTCTVCSRGRAGGRRRSSQTVRSSAPSGTAARVELVQMPAQPLLARRRSSTRSSRWSTSSFSSRSRCLTRPRMIEPRLPQRRPRDGERVDRVGLAARPAARRCGAVSFGGTRTSRSPGCEQLPLERAGQLPAVLERPQPLGRKRARPGRAARRRRPRPSARRAARPSLVDGDRRQRLLVHVHSDHDHSDRLLQHWGRPASGQTSIEAAATLLSGHARRSREGGGDTTLASQPRATCGNRVSRRRPESQPLDRTPPPPRAMTLSSGMSLELVAASAFVERALSREGRPRGSRVRSEQHLRRWRHARENVCSAARSLHAPAAASTAIGDKYGSGVVHSEGLAPSS